MSRSGLICSGAVTVCLLRIARTPDRRPGARVRGMGGVGQPREAGLGELRRQTQVIPRVRMAGMVPAPGPVVNAGRAKTQGDPRWGNPVLGSALLRQTHQGGSAHMAGRRHRFLDDARGRRRAARRDPGRRARGHGRDLGRQRLRPTRRRHVHPAAHGGRCERALGRGPAPRRSRARRGAQGRRHRLDVGPQRLRPARHREHHEPEPAGAGARHHRRDRRSRRAITRASRCSRTAP